MTENQIRRHGKAILAAVRQGAQNEPTHPPRRTRLDEDHVLRLEVLKEWRKKEARQMGVESDVVLPRDLMCMIAKKNPTDFDALSTIMNETPWRLERFGREINTVLRNGYRG
jgi:ribonuclease D